MGRIWHTGFEINGNGYEWATVGSPVVQGTTVRSGNKALQVPSLSAVTQKGCQTWFAGGSNNNGPFYARFYLRVATRPSAGNSIFYFSSQGSISNIGGGIKLNNNGSIALFDEDGQIGVDSSVLSLNTWYRIEIKYDRTAAAGSHVVEAKIDGVVFATSSTRNISTGVMRIYFGGNMASENQSTGNWFFDDMALNDSSGSVQNGYPGAGQIETIFPVGAGDNAGMTRGGTDSGANWSQVDENPPNDVTDYNSSNSLNVVDDYDMATTSFLASGDTVNVVSVHLRNTGASSSSVAAAKARIKSQASGTVTEGTAITPISTTWQTDASFNSGGKANFVFATGYMTYVDPQAGGSWTKALVDAIQAGFRISTGSTNAFRVSALWVNIDYTPSTTAIKTILGLAKASVKTVNGLAIASVKKWNGLA